MNEKYGVRHNIQDKITKGRRTKKKKKSQTENRKRSLLTVRRKTDKPTNLVRRCVRASKEKKKEESSLLLNINLRLLPSEQSRRLTSGSVAWRGISGRSKERATYIHIAQPKQEN